VEDDIIPVLLEKEDISGIEFVEFSATFDIDLMRVGRGALGIRGLRLLVSI